MTVVLRSEGDGFATLGITGVASTANAGQGSVANWTGHSLAILEAWITPLVQSTGAANLNIGVTTITASANDVLVATAMGSPTVNTPINCFAQDPGAATAIVPAIWTTALFLTFTASATLVGFTGVLHLRLLRVPTAVNP